MARPLRLEFPGALYHITSRGNGRAPIYLDDDDYGLFLVLLGEVCERMNGVCHAYCLMTNHYHLIIETPDGNLSRGMRQLNGVYTQRFNRRHARVGHVFQGRYKAILVDRDSYLLELARYVVLNPVRAGMVTEPGHWPWSSYRETAGLEQAPAWLATDWLLKQFGETGHLACQRYIQFVEGGKDQPSVWNSLRGQIYLGDERFVERMQSRIEDQDALAEVPRAQKRAMAKSLDQFAREYNHRSAAMAAAYQSGHHTMKAIADYFGVHYSTVSRAVRLAENGELTQVQHCNSRFAHLQSHF